MTSSFCRADAARMISLLACPNTLLAIRALNPPQEKRFRYDQQETALRLLEKLSGARPLYVSLNPVKAETTSPFIVDEDVQCLRWFPLDADPVRPPDTASTDSEKAAAFEVMGGVVKFLSSLLPGIEKSVLRADSGNGAHTLLRLPDYPVDEAARLKLIGNAICRRFSTAGVNMDRAIYNPSRIWRAYGTLNIKGANTPERPHRRAGILAGQADPVPFDILADWDTLSGELDLQEAKPKANILPPRVAAGETEPESASRELPQWWAEIISAGERNSAAFRRARWLLNSHEGGRSEKDAWEQLVAWNKVCCRPSLVEVELRKVLGSAAKVGDNPSFTAPPAAPARQPTWPVLDEAAFYGLAGDIVRAIEPHTEADPIALLIQILAAFGSCVGRGPHVMAEADRHGANLFLVLVGTTSKGRKGSSWGHVLRLFQAAAPQWANTRILSGLSSGEGLIYNVRDAVEKLEKDKKTGDMQNVTVDEGIDDKRLLIYEAEFASVLRQTQRDGNTLSPTLRNAWDSRKLQSLTKNNPTCATDTHVSIIGHITRDELRRDLSETESANGFGNRFLWLCVKRSKELPDGGAIGSVDFSNLVSRMQSAISHASTSTLLWRDPIARDIWYAVYHDLSTGKPGLLGAMTGRAEAQVMRLALLFALLDGASHIGANHLTAALALWEYCEDSAAYIFGTSLGDRVADEILRALRQTPTGLSRTELSKLFGNNQSAARIGQALEVLSECGLARAERREPPDGSGRPTEYWVATK